MRQPGLRSFLIAAFVPWICLAAGAAYGQGTGEFLCSGGSRDGLSCESFDDCPSGVCVIAQGICSDGFICDCPSGTCSNSTRCAEDQTFGTCASGVSPGLCCDVALNCTEGACVGTQKVCINGTDQGFSCTDSSQCNNGTCASTGCFCDGGDFDAFTCVTTGDCPGGGTCTCFAEPTATPIRTFSPTPPTAVPPTNTRTPGTPVSTNTPQPSPTGFDTRTPPPSSTPIQTSTSPINTNTPRPTDTPAIGSFVTTAVDAFAGADQIRLAADPRTLPIEGIVRIAGRDLRFTRRRSSPILDIQEEFGLPVFVPAGSAVLLVEATPTPGPSQNEYRGEAEGCQVTTASAREISSAGAAGLFGFALILGAVRRRR